MCISWLNLQLMNLVESHYRISMLRCSHHVESSIILLELRCISRHNLQLMNLVESHYRISMLRYSHHVESSIILLELRCISWLNLQLMNLVESHYRISMLRWSTLLGKQYNITGVEVYILKQFITYEFSWVPLQDFHVMMIYTTWKAVYHYWSWGVYLDTIYNLWI